ncbi:hypothetical protein HPG69_001899, partial [Diceros bicornis minor]
YSQVYISTCGDSGSTGSDREEQSLSTGKSFKHCFKTTSTSKNLKVLSRFQSMKMLQNWRVLLRIVVPSFHFRLVGNSSLSPRFYKSSSNNRIEN